MFKWVGGLIAVVGLLAAGAWMYSRASAFSPERAIVSQVVPDAGPDPKSVAMVSLKAIRKQNRMTAMVASYVAVVTTEQTRMGGVFRSRNTLVIPGRVRYEVDLMKLTPDDLEWDQGTKTLRVTLPPVEAAKPEIDIAGLRSYSEGVLTSFAGVAGTLDAQNRSVGQQKLIEQSHNAAMLTRAHDAAAQALQQTFAMPMRAAGIEANVIVS